MPYPASILADEALHYWNVILIDRPDSLEGRNAVMDEHKARLTSFKQQHPGVINFGGPALDPTTHQMVGTSFILKRGKAFPSKDAVEAWVQLDPYHQTGVWVKHDILLFAAFTQPIAALAKQD